MDIFNEYKITQQEFEKKEKKILEHLTRIQKNTLEAIKLLDENDHRKFIETTTISILIYADTMSEFFRLFKNKITRNNEKQFREWVDKFVLNEKNNIYKKRKKDINCDSMLVWKLRNALVHFYGLPNLKNEQIMLINGRWQNERGKKIRKHFLVKGINLRIVDIVSLRQAILNAVFPMIDYFKKILEEKPEQYVRGIMNILKVSEKACSAKIDVTTAKNIE